MISRQQGRKPRVRPARLPKRAPRLSLVRCKADETSSTYSGVETAHHRDHTLGWNAYDAARPPTTAPTCTRRPTRFPYRATAIQACTTTRTRHQGPCLNRGSNPVEGGCANDYVYVADPVNQFDLTGMAQSCSNAQDGTGFGGAGLGTLTRQSDGKYNLQVKLFDHFLAQFGATTVSTGYRVTYKVNGHSARGQFAGDINIRPAYDDIHTRQVVQGRKYRDRGFFSRKQHTIKSGDTLYLGIEIYFFDPVNQRTFGVRGSITCQV